MGPILISLLNAIHVFQLCTSHMNNGCLLLFLVMRGLWKCFTVSEMLKTPYHTIMIYPGCPTARKKHFEALCAILVILYELTNNYSGQKAAEYWALWDIMKPEHCSLTYRQYHSFMKLCLWPIISPKDIICRLLVMHLWSSELVVVVIKLAMSLYLSQSCTLTVFPSIILSMVWIF